MSSGRAVAFGAVTIVNAISCGLGAALAVDLKTEASVELTNEPGRIEGRILPDYGENTDLIKQVAHRVLQHFRLEKRYGAFIETKSKIPIARGLKSSSAAANAVALAVYAALGKEVDDLTVVNLGVDASIDAGVSITGAFDDACASYFGNIIVTDNYKRRIMKQFSVDMEYSVLIHVPKEKSYTADSNVGKMKLISNEVRAIHRMALSAKYWAAMTLNGFAYSAVLGYNPSVAVDALEAGAVAAGLSGKGPAVAAVISEDSASQVKDAWKKYDGEIIETVINREKAHILW